MRGMCTEKKELYINKGPRKSRFHLNLPDVRVASLLKRVQGIIDFKWVVWQRRFETTNANFGSRVYISKSTFIFSSESTL